MDNSVHKTSQKRRKTVNAIAIAIANAQPLFRASLLLPGISDAASPPYVNAAGQFSADVVEASMVRQNDTTESPTIQTAEQWIETVLRVKGIDQPLAVSRFLEPMYYLLKPINWSPNPDNGSEYSPVVVPTGFVTDLASIPTVLFPVLRPDGQYMQAAIVHDYLYWFQISTREHADNVFRIAMRDLEVKPAVVSVIFSAVRAFGQKAWDDNRDSKERGERRVLKVFPKNSTTYWRDWKKHIENFSD